MGVGRTLAIGSTFMLVVTNVLGWVSWALLYRDDNSPAVKSILAFVCIGAAIHFGLLVLASDKSANVNGAHLCHFGYYAMLRTLISSDDAMVDGPIHADRNRVAFVPAPALNLPRRKYSELDITLALYQIFNTQMPIHMLSTLPLAITETTMVGNGNLSGILIVSMIVSLASLCLGFIFLLGAGEGVDLTDGLCDVVGGARALETHRPELPPVLTRDEIVQFMLRIDAYPNTVKLGRMAEADSRGGMDIAGLLRKHDASPLVCYYVSVTLASLGFAHRYSAPSPLPVPNEAPISARVRVNAVPASIVVQSVPHDLIVPPARPQQQQPPPAPSLHAPHDSLPFVGVHQRVFSGDAVGGGDASAALQVAVVNPDGSHAPVTTIDMRNMAPPPAAADAYHAPPPAHGSDENNNPPAYPGQINDPS